MDKEELHDLNGEQLVAVAMFAFVHMYDKGEKPKDELLEEIIHWFRIMTIDLTDDLDVEEVVFLDDEKIH